MNHLTLLEDAIQFWQPTASRRLTLEDARQAIEHIDGFFSTLQRWASASEAAEADRKTEVQCANPS
jgi:hypothetical protein